MVVIASRGRYEARATYEDRHRLKACGWSWDPAGKAWWTADKANLERLMNASGEDGIELIEEASGVELDLPTSWDGHPSCATDGPDDIPCPPGLSYLPYQKGGIAFARGRDGVLIADEPGLGKAQPVDEPVLTPDGFVPIGSLKVGDMVIGSSGQSVAVTGVFPQGEKLIRRVILTDGSWTRCCDEHLWAYQTKNQRERGGWSVGELQNIKIHDNSGYRQAFLPMVCPVELSARACEMEPWLLGVLIGDGTYRNHSVMLSNPEEDILKAVNDALPAGVELVHSEGCDWRLSFKKGVPNPVTQKMRAMGLMGRGSHERFVPKSYLVGSSGWRLALLQGLFDTDGTPTESGCVEYCTTSRQLADDVCHLVQSLGGTCSIYLRPDPKYTHNGEKRTGRPAWRCYAKLPEGVCPFLHSGQKRERMWAGKRQREPYRAIKEVVEDGVGECVCIAVDAPDHLYVTRHFIVTHNTIQAIGILNDEPVRTVLVIVPASLKINWQREFDKWLNYYLPVHVVMNAKAPIPAKVGVVIVNYDIVAKLRPRLDAVEWDALICDESHLLKNPETKRALAVVGKGGRGGIAAKRRIFLTGTPLESRPAEVFTTANALRPDVFPSWLDFAFRYCAARMTPYGLDARGASNTAELQAKLRTTVMVRRMKVDVLKDLPDKIRTRVLLPCDAKLKARVLAEKAAYERERAIYGRLKESGADQGRLQQALAESSARMTDLRVATTEGKMPMALEFLRNAASEEKVIVFAVHHVVLDALKKEFGEAAVAVDGQVSVADRQKAVDRFQTDPECRVFIGQIIAAGVGLTLTASCHVAFLEYDWRPGVMLQAEDRAHRIGQKDCVRVSYLVIEDSLDDVQLASVAKKQETVSKAINV